MPAESNKKSVLVLTGARIINKRMSLFIEGVIAAGVPVRVFALPRGKWKLDRSERPLCPCLRNWLSVDFGDTRQSQLASVMCFHWLVLPVAVLIGLLKRVPVLYDEHDHYELNTAVGGGSAIRRVQAPALVKWFHRICLPWVSVVTCIHMDRQILKRHLEQWQSSIIEIHNYPAAVWRESARTLDSHLPLCFVYIGGVFSEKGPEAAAEALQLLSEHERRGSTVHVFGDGDPALLSRLKKVPHVVIHRSVTPSEFRTFAANHRCCGLSLLSNTPRYRLVGTNCTKLYEYLALGMPVIVTNVGEFPQFMTTHQVGLVVDGEMNPDELAAAMRTMLNDTRRFDEMSYNAVTLMSTEEMTWEHEWQKIERSQAFNNIQRAA